MTNSRKLVSWRIDNLEQREQDILNEWLDNQQNIQKSITNVVLHMVARFGTTDIMSYETQKVLYTELVGHVAPIKQEENKPELVQVETNSKTVVHPVDPIKNDTNEDDDDSLYKDLNL